MKHALVLEVLERTGNWAGVVYGETHAGAGLYHSGDQTEDGYIRDLRHKVENAPNKVIGPGLGYLTSLREWWDDPANREAYPGSGITVLRWLQRHRPEVTPDIRLTEMDRATWGRLRQSLGPFGHAAKQESFSDELEWLTEAENLILLVDPFGCVESFSKTGSGRGIGDGWIDHSTVTDILLRCEGKRRAVVSLWWGFGQALRDHHRATCDLLNRLTLQKGSAVCRVFHDNRNHANAIVGIGAGAEIVRGLPTRASWQDSWLKDAVYEKS